MIYYNWSDRSKTNYFIKNDRKIICGTGEGVINIFNYDQYGNISDRFPGHPSSIDCFLALSNNVVLTGCFDGNIRYENKYLYLILKVIYS